MEMVHKYIRQFNDDVKGKKRRLSVESRLIQGLRFRLSCFHQNLHDRAGHGRDNDLFAQNMTAFLLFGEKGLSLRLRNT